MRFKAQESDVFDQGMVPLANIYEEFGEEESSEPVGGFGSVFGLEVPYFYRAVGTFGEVDITEVFEYGMIPEDEGSFGVEGVGRIGEVDVRPLTTVFSEVDNVFEDPETVKTRGGFGG